MAQFLMPNGPFGGHPRHIRWGDEAVTSVKGDAVPVRATRVNDRALSLRGRLMGAVTSAIMLPLLRNGNAAPRTRKRIELLGKLFGQTQRGMRIQIGMLDGVSVETVLPRKPRSQSCIMYLHGGAYVSGSPRSYRRLISHLARATGCRVISVDYRLAPEHPYPAALDDSLAVYRALLAEGQDAANLFIAGDSAGGGLTLATALALRDSGLPLPAGLLCIAPWTDLTGSGESMRTRSHRERMMNPSGLAIDARNYAGKESLRNPLISPLFADLSGLPPLMIQVGDDEVLLDDSTRIAEAASRDHISVALRVWPHLWHVWHLYAGLFPEADAAIEEMAEFVAERRG